MSVRIMAQVWEHANSEGTELLVLLAMADFADDNGTCWPSMKAIAKRVRRSDRAVRSIIRNLEARGVLECPEKAGGRGRSNRYLIVIKAEAQTSEYYADEKAEKAEAQTSEFNDAKGGSLTLKAEAQTSEEPSLRTTKKEKKEYSPAFLSFWAAYPRRLEKKAAARKFEAAVKSGVPSQHIIDAAGRYAAHVAESRTEERFIKHPTTWLNQGCWDDELKPMNNRSAADDKFARKMEMAKHLHKRREGEPPVDNGAGGSDTLALLPARHNG